MRDLALLPKAELHLHMLGAMRLTTLHELAAEAGRPAPDPRVFTTFDEFQAIFRAAFVATQTRLENLCRVVREVVADAAADGVVWVQPHFDPHVYAAFGPADAVMETVVAQGREAGARLGVGFGVTLSVMRHLGPEAAERRARFAARWADGRGAYALGLTGDEALYPPAPFARAFALAREAGLEAAPHAGELAGPETVRAAVHTLGATRVAHGVRAIEDAELVEEIARRGITLDVCPTSNIRLGVVPDAANHPLPRLLEAGVACTLGADDPLLFGVGTLDEYERARTHIGLDDARLAALARTSVMTSAAPAAVKQDAARRIDRWLTDDPAADPKAVSALHQPASRSSDSPSWTLGP